MSTLIATVRTKRVDWSRVYNFDFSAFGEFSEDSETISTAEVTSLPSGLTVGSATIDNLLVQVRISGGVAGVSYTLECQITTSSGSVLKLQGILNVVA
jgi:hypothetical protein